MGEDYEKSIHDEECENCIYYNNESCIRKTGIQTQKICAHYVNIWEAKSADKALDELIDSVAELYGVLCGAIGGSFKTFLERAKLALPDCFVHTGNFVASFIIGLIKAIIYLVVCAVLALFETIKSIWDSKRTIKKINKIVDEDNESVKLVRDYLEYSRCVSKEKNNTLKELVSDCGKLYGNSFVKLMIDYDVNYAVDELKHRLNMLEKNQDAAREI